MQGNAGRALATKQSPENVPPTSPDTFPRKFNVPPTTEPTERALWVMRPIHRAQAMQLVLHRSHLGRNVPHLTGRDWRVEMATANGGGENG